MGEGYKRSKPYKENSTKGSALLHQPRRYKGDVMVQVWMDSRMLATLSQWLDSGGHLTRFMSDVVRDTLQTVTEHLVENGEVEMVDDTADAREMLEGKYRIDLNPSGRGLKNAHHNMLLSEKRKGLDTMKYSTDQVRDYTPIGGKIGHVSTKFMDEFVKTYEKVGTERKNKDKEEEMRKHKEHVKYDKNGVCILSDNLSNIVTPGDMNKWNKEGAKQEVKKNEVPTETTKSVKHSDIPRAMTEEELDEKAREIEKKDKEQAEALKEM